MLDRFRRKPTRRRLQQRMFRDRDFAPSYPRKEDADCCVARRDDVGRLPIGFCSPTCERRPAKAGA